jgi:hypothetical protein
MSFVIKSFPAAVRFIEDIHAKLGQPCQWQRNKTVACFGNVMFEIYKESILDALGKRTNMISVSITPAPNARFSSARPQFADAEIPLVASYKVMPPADLKAALYVARGLHHKFV